MDLPRTTFGKSTVEVTRVGLGGEGVLRTFGREDEARAVICAALDAGIGYYDTARAYAGSESYLGSVWKERPGAREKVFHTGKSAQRRREPALFDLNATLANLGTGCLDLWQIHDVRTMDDVRAIEASGGALSAFMEARESGRARYVGVTGHHDPAVLTHCAKHWPVDAVLLPVNPVEAALGGFLDKTVEAARKRGLGVIGMKVLGGAGAGYLSPEAGLTAESLIRFALCQDVDVVLVGCSTPSQVQTLAAAAQAGPLSERDRRMLAAAFLPFAERLAHYRGVL